MLQEVSRPRVSYEYGLEPYEKAYTAFRSFTEAMVGTIFTVTPPPDNVFLGIFIFTALAVFIGGISRYRKFGTDRKKLASIVIMLAVISSGMILGGFYLQRSMTSSATIEIGNHFIAIDSGETGVVNVSSSQIVDAYVAQIDTGNLTLATRNYGFTNGVDNIGIYTLGNGATAYVVSSVQQDLIIQMVSGKYMIVGNENLTQLVSVFSQDVFNVTT